MITKRIPGAREYLVDEVGRITSLVPWRGSHVRFLSGGIGPNGYRLVALRGDAGRRLYRYIHRLVCEAFHGPPPPDHEVRHLNGDKLDNRATNLAWGTRRENVADQFRHGQFRVGSRCNLAKLDERRVAAVKRDLARDVAVGLIARREGVASSTISAIKAGKTWRHV